MESQHPSQNAGESASATHGLICSEDAEKPYRAWDGDIVCMQEVQEVGPSRTMWDVLAELGEGHVRICEIGEPCLTPGVVEGHSRR